MILAITPALVERGGDPLPGADIAAVLGLLDLQPGEPLPDGTSLTTWARSQREALGAAAEAARVDALVAEALATAPPDVDRH